jgi:hypothetical protein
LGGWVGPGSYNSVSNQMKTSIINISLLYTYIAQLLTAPLTCGVDVAHVDYRLHCS